MNILIVNGPNLNMLGIREKEIYGDSTYEDLISYLDKAAEELGVKIEVFQSNYEGAIIDKIHEAYYQKVNGIVINPGALTHYSYALRDAILAVDIKTVEVHLSAVKERESFRSISVLDNICLANISGDGFNGYRRALEILKGDNL